ncbi:oxalurate catabolism protein HpxZ [Microvirga sp. BT689]|nr:oxalurate catabolism protein HpxZ [Microvirga arvi]
MPDVVYEVEVEFLRYEEALRTNNTETLGSQFWHDRRTVRYGMGGENQYGWDEIQSFRVSRPPIAGEWRRLDRTTITTFGRDLATASTLFLRDDAPGLIGRQMQTWVRMPDGWRVVAAHVSVVDAV